MDEEKVLDGTQNPVVEDEVTELYEVDDFEPEEGFEDAELDDADEADDAEQDEEPIAQKRVQSKEENAKYAAARREAEAKEREERARREEAEQAYLAMKTKLQEQAEAELTPELEQQIRERAIDEGRDPDLAVILEEKRIERQARKARAALEEAARAQKAAQEQHEKALKAKAAAEVAELESKRGIKFADLRKVPGFEEYAKHKYGRWTLDEIVEGFELSKGKITAIRQSRSNRSTGFFSTAASSLSAAELASLNEINRSLKESGRKPLTEAQYLERKKYYSRR